MMIRRFAWASLIVWALALWYTPVAASAAQTGAETAQVFIEGLADEAVQALTAEGVTRADRITRFRELLSHNFDVPLIGKWVLGRYWRTATDAEKEEYLKLFEDYVVITYVERFDQYSGEVIKVVKSVSDPGKDSLVYSEIHRPTGGEPIRIDWRVSNNADVYKIIDVYVEGISMSQSQRKEFTSVIRANGGTVAGLIGVLRKKVESLSN
ncbi:ABC transporter substrate-binding protein [Magnetovibrio sp.]|uniref:MlaC/ttg2D family ABC transporter substrate-binding protein n=1 Tax=Magnetovibrio sp. TaxID=2024836 RepID=UPI002F93E4DC